MIISNHSTYTTFRIKQYLEVQISKIIGPAAGGDCVSLLKYDKKQELKQKSNCFQQILRKNVLIRSILGKTVIAMS